MQIINHYKNEVNKSIRSLQQEGIITEDQMREGQSSTEHSQEHSMRSQLAVPNNSGESEQSTVNPYKQLTKPTNLPKASRCIVCHTPSKYRCPQCMIPYCSSTHYKSHNLFCSQTFYKRQVETEMKSIKSTKAQKQQIRQLLKEDNLSKGEDDRLNGMTEERLVQLLEVIEKCEKEGRQVDDELVKLSEEQRVRLDQFIKEAQGQESQTSNINSHQVKQHPTTNNSQHRPALQLSAQPYWLIPDGLDYYFMLEIQIQQFAQSSHLELIIYRESLAKKYRQEIKNLSYLTKGKVSPLVEEDILQYLVIWVLVNVAWGNQPSDKEEIFELFGNLYVKDLAKEITEKGIKELEAGAYTLAQLKQNISNLKEEDTRNLLNSWYKATVISSCKLIVKNKLLLIQTFLRLLEFFQNQQQQISTKDLKNSKKKLHQAIKHVKKLQFLLSYIKDQTQSKQQSQLQNSPKQNLFRHLYRTLSQQECEQLKNNEQITQFKKDKQNLEQIKKNGILIQELQ